MAQTRRAFELQQRIPADLTARIAELSPESETVWAKARIQNDFQLFKPYLERMLALKIELAEAIGYEAHPFDALMSHYEPGMTAARLRPNLFGELKAGICRCWRESWPRIPARRLISGSTTMTSPRKGNFCLEMAELIGFDFSRGRLDSTTHPFEISFTREDVRITTRYYVKYLPMALFATLHETGHGLYEQNIAPELTRSALTINFAGQYAVGGPSSGMNEFSSRLWENQIGRSRAFWDVNFHHVQKHFPRQMAGVDAEVFHRAVNRVRPSLNRVAADEVTYNLHIMLRTEIEMGLLTGEVKVDDLPELWNAKMQEYLGVTPPDDSEGVLQDVHWSAGLFGSFPGYTLGNLIAAQVFEAAHAQMPDLDERLADGDYRALLDWLTENIYRHGRAYSVSELLLRVTGADLHVAPLLRYLEAKYADLYQLK